MHNLNDEPDMIEKVQAGGYRALHYVDYNADGWIDVECSELALEVPRRLPAYSIVASPHFFPFINQTDLMQWTNQSVLPSLVQYIWDASGGGPPQALSDQRYAANLKLDAVSFDPQDDTMTAIVGLYGSSGAPTRIERAKNHRASMLPDSAAGVFAPGWDVSYDRTSETDAEDTGNRVLPGITFLTNYGLGSPFPEDSKLCAALSAFWPAAAPDISRTFSPTHHGTATPLPDDLIGLGEGLPWDGVVGPKIRESDRVVEFAALAYGDYVETVLDKGFDIRTIGLTSVEEYEARTLTMALVYQALGSPAYDPNCKCDGKWKWSVLSFHRAAHDDPDLDRARSSTGRRTDSRYTYRYLMFQHDDLGAPDPEQFDRILVPYKKLTLLFADPSIVLLRQDDGSWLANELRH